MIWLRTHQRDIMEASPPFSLLFSPYYPFSVIAHFPLIKEKHIQRGTYFSDIKLKNILKQWCFGGNVIFHSGSFSIQLSTKLQKI